MRILSLRVVPTVYHFLGTLEGLPLLVKVKEGGKNGRNQGQAGNQQEDGRKMLLDQGNPAEEITTKAGPKDPQTNCKQIIKGKVFEVKANAAGD